VIVQPLEHGRKAAKRGLVDCDGLRPLGHSYFLRGGVETALLAARSIVTGSDYSLAG